MNNLFPCPPTPPPSSADTVSLYEDSLMSNDDRESTGSELSLEMTGNPVYRRESVTSEDSLNLESLVTDIGRSLWPVSENNPYRESDDSSRELDTGSSPDQRPPTPMFGRRIRGTATRLNLENGRLNEIALPTGIKSECLHVQERLMKFPLIFSYEIMDLSFAFGPTIYNQLLNSVPVKYFGVQLVLENRVPHGQTLDSRLILKIPDLSSGVVTLVNQELLLMNLEVGSTSHTCYDGWIVIHAEWNLRVPPIR